MLTPHVSRLTRISDSSRTKGNRKYGMYRCLCGTTKHIRDDSVKSGAILSCGCLSKEITAKRMRKHGGNGTCLYNVFRQISQRCYNPNSREYSSYGGRGIRMCSEWKGKNGFIQFLNDMGPRPSPKHSIDRKNNDGDYCPENCRWATKTQQHRNRQNNINITYDGRTMCLFDWCVELNLAYTTTYYRIKSGWSVASAFTVHPKRRGR